MSLSHEYKVLFIHVPKCGGSSIEQALGIPLSLRDHNDLDYYRVRFPEVCGNYWRATSIRHPFDRFISAWAYTRQCLEYCHPVLREVAILPFQDFLQRLQAQPSFLGRVLSWRHFMPQTAFVGTDLTWFDEVLRLEEFGEGFKLPGHAPFVLQHTNRATERDSVKYLESPDDRGFLAALYADDFDALGYDDDCSDY